MPIKIGLTNIKDVKLGNSQIAKVFRGTDLVWQNVRWVKHSGMFVVGTSPWTNGNTEKSIGTFSYLGKPIYITKAIIPYEVDDVGTFIGGGMVYANNREFKFVEGYQSGTTSFSGQTMTSNSVNFKLGTFSGDGRSRRVTVVVTEFYAYE